MITPQLTEQYGHVERVSVVREIFSARDCAYAGFKSKPSSETIVPPAPTFKKALRVEAIGAPPTSDDVIRYRSSECVNGQPIVLAAERLG